MPFNERNKAEVLRKQQDARKAKERAERESRLSKNNYNNNDSRVWKKF